MTFLERNPKAREYLKNYPIGGIDNKEGRKRGKRNEKRALYLMNVLVEEGKLKKCVRSGKKHDRKGVDFWAYPNNAPEGFRVPFQIKSSHKWAESFRERGRSKNSIAVIVITDDMTDTYVKKKIIREMNLWIKRNASRAGMAEVVNAPV